MSKGNKKIGIELPKDVVQSMKDFSKTDDRTVTAEYLRAVGLLLGNDPHIFFNARHIIFRRQAELAVRQVVGDARFSVYCKLAMFVTDDGLGNPSAVEINGERVAALAEEMKKKPDEIEREFHTVAVLVRDAEHALRLAMHKWKEANSH